MRMMGTLALAVLSLSGGILAQNPASVARATIATVNNQPITQADLDRARTANTAAPLGRVLVALVDEELLLQRGKNLGYEVSDQQLRFILEKVKRQNNLSSDQQLDGALNQTEMTRTQLRAKLERALIVARVLQSEGLTQVSDEDAQRYFDTHESEFPLQTFELAKPDVIERLTSDRTTENVLARPYLQSLRRRAAIVWTQPDLQQAYEQASQ